MTEESKKPIRAFRLAGVAIVFLAGLLLVGAISYVVFRNRLPWRHIVIQSKNSGPEELAKYHNVAGSLSDEAILQRLREIRGAYVDAADKSSVEAEVYYESKAFSDELLKRLRSGTDSKDRLVKIFANATVLKFDADRSLPIVAGENSAANISVSMFPPLPSCIANEHAFAKVRVSAKLNGQPVGDVVSPSEHRHDFVSWFKFQVRSDQFRPGQNTLSAQAHVKMLLDGKSGASRTRPLEWDTPVVTETLVAGPRRAGDLVKQVSRSEDVASMRRHACVRLGPLIPSERQIDIDFDFPVFSVPICAMVSVHASDGSWADDDQVLAVPVGPKCSGHLMVFFGENVKPPYEDNLRVDIEIRPAPQQAIWKDMPEIAGFCAKWENVGIESGKQPKGVLPTSVEGDCSK